MSWIKDKLTLQYRPSDKELYAGFADANAARYAKKIISNNLLKQSTVYEEKVWEFLAKKPLKTRWVRQKPISDYFADFACAKLKTVIEIDGLSHNQEYDERRDARLWRMGWQTIRFTNDEVDRDFDMVCQKIIQTISYDLQKIEEKKVLCNAPRS